MKLVFFGLFIEVGGKYLGRHALLWLLNHAYGCGGSPAVPPVWLHNSSEDPRSRWCWSDRRRERKGSCWRTVYWSCRVGSQAAIVVVKRVRERRAKRRISRAGGGRGGGKEYSQRNRL